MTIYSPFYPGTDFAGVEGSTLPATRNVNLGDWNSIPDGTILNPGDTVQYNGSIYTVVTSNTKNPGVTPVDNNNYIVFSTGGKAIMVTPDKWAFTYVNGVLSPSSQTLTFTATLYNDDTPITWTTTPNIKNLVGGNVFTLNNTEMGSNRQVIVTASAGELSQSIIVGKTADPSATQSRTFRQATAPSSPSVYDLWIDTSGIYEVAKTWNGTQWIPAATNTTDTVELFDGAALGATAVVIDPTGSITIYADSTGTIKTGELPKDVAITASGGGSGIPSTTVVAAKNGVASLDETGVVPLSQTNPAAITDVFTVGSEAEMLALDATKGDYAIRTDLGNALYLNNGGTSGTSSDWTAIIGSGGSGGSGSGFYNRYLGTGAQTQFTIPQGISSPGEVIVTKNGLRQDPGGDYTIAGNVLTTATAPSNTDILIIERSAGSTSASSLIINCGGAAGVANPLIRINGGTA